LTVMAMVPVGQLQEMNAAAAVIKKDRSRSENFTSRF